MTNEESVRARVRFFSIMMGLVFLVTGVAKLLGLEQQYGFFEELGLPRALVPVAGVIELCVAILTLNRSTQSYGAVAVVLVMGGAALAHIMSGARLHMLFVNAYFLASAIWVVRMDRPRFLRVA